MKWVITCLDELEQDVEQVIVETPLVGATVQRLADSYADDSHSIEVEPESLVETEEFKDDDEDFDGYESED